MDSGMRSRQRKLAERNLIAADENYQLARKSVDQLFTQVADNKLLNEPYMEGLRFELLESARTFYQEFVAKRRDDPSAANELSMTRLRLADIAWQLGKHNEAISELRAARLGAQGISSYQSGLRMGSYLIQLGRLDEAQTTLDATIKEIESQRFAKPGEEQLSNLLARILEQVILRRRKGESEAAIAEFTKAAEILEPIVQQRSVVDDNYRDLASIYIDRGQLAFQVRDDSAAEEWFKKALSLRRAYSASRPNSTQARLGLAVVLSNLSGPLRRMNRHAEAIRLLEEAVQIARELVQNHPGVASYQNDLAAGLGNLSVVLKTSGQPARANEVNRESIAILTGVAQQHPTIATYALSLGAIEGNEGNSELDAKHWSEAILWFDRSIATLKRMPQQTNDPRVRSVLRNDYWGKADAHVALKQFHQAIPAFEKAAELSSASEQAEVRLARAMALARSGDHTAAMHAADAESMASPSDKLFGGKGRKFLCLRQPPKPTRH